MDKIIQKYDYVKATEDDQHALEELLNDLPVGDLAEKVSLSDIKNIINILIQKICNKEFVAKVPRYSPGTWMSTCSVRILLQLIEYAVDNSRITESEALDCIYDFIVAIIRTTPGSSHYEVLEQLENYGEMSNYLKNITGERLEQYAAALKAHQFIQEDMPLEDQCSLMNSFMSRLVEYIVRDREDSKDIHTWTVFLDLYLFYILHTSDVPNGLHEALEYCGNVFWYHYDRNPYKGFPDTKVLSEHLEKIGNFLMASEFPRGRQLRVTDYIEYLVDIKNDQLIAVFPEMMTCFKSVCLSTKAKEMKKLIKAFRHVFDKMEKTAIQKNPKVFESWASTMIDILDRMEDKMLLNDVMDRMISDLRDKYKPAKGDEKYWFKLIKGMLAIPEKSVQQCVKRILQEKAWKRMWNWKENIQEVKEWIMVIEGLTLPTEATCDDYWQVRDTACNCGEAVEKLLEMLKIVKIAHLIMPELSRMTMTHMETKTHEGNNMVDRYIKHLDFEKCTEVIPEVVKRFEPLLYDEDYPWLDSMVASNGLCLFDLCFEPYKNSEMIPNEVNEAVIRMIDFALDEDKEFIKVENGSMTLYTMLVAHSTIFTSMHCTGGTGKITIPVLRKLLKFRNFDENTVRKSAEDSFSIAGACSPDILVELLDPLLDWYIEDQPENLLSIFMRVLVLDPEPVKRKMDDFLKACKKDSEHCSIQVQIFYTMSQKHPEVVTANMMEFLLTEYYDAPHCKSQILMIMHCGTTVHPEYFEPYMNKLLNDQTITNMEQHWVNLTIVNVAKNNEKYKQPVLEYLINVLKKANDETRYAVTLKALQDLCIKYGPDMFSPYKEYLINKRDTEQNTSVQQGFTALIDQIEGRSLETVEQDVKDTKVAVGKIDDRVTGNEVAVAGLTTKVEQQGEDIQELGEGLDTVTQRVDLAEKDIEETKIKVEEVDMKTMSNAPRWSRDLTKLMNPKSDHDWRLLAQRLGYNNDDIRAWASQHDPCMAVLSEWYATHKTREANYAVLTALQEMNRMDGAAIVENAMKAVADVVEDEEVEYASPPPVFLSYQWGHQNEVKLIRNHLQMAGYECWMDIGQMGGGDKLFEKIDNGIRGAKVIICCVSEKYAASPNCNREVNLSVNLGKPMIPLLMEKMSWPPKGSMGPIFSEYLFVRFFQRAGEETEDERIWPVAKFQEMLMQLNCYNVKPEESLIDDMYKNWWIPVQEIIVIDKSKKQQQPQIKPKHDETTEENKSPEIFISYQWGKQKQIIALYQRLTGMGFNCWLDIHQMGGGDSLYEKIDSGVRGCKVILTCITQKYALSANCRREVSLADALKKPMIPLLLEKMDWPPSGPMSMVFTQLLFINFYRDEEVQMRWDGAKFDELLQKIGEHIPMILPGNEDNNEQQGDKNDGNSQTKKDKTDDGDRHQEDEKQKSNGTIDHQDNVENTSKPDDEKKPKNDNERKTSNVARPVSSRNKRGTGGPQPTENRPTPVPQPKPVPSAPTMAQSSASENSRSEQAKTEKKSKSCTVL